MEWSGTDKVMITIRGSRGELTTDDTRHEGLCDATFQGASVSDGLYWTCALGGKSVPVPVYLA